MHKWTISICYLPRQSNIDHIFIHLLCLVDYKSWKKKWIWLWRMIMEVMLGENAKVSGRKNWHKKIWKYFSFSSKNLKLNLIKESSLSFKRGVASSHLLKRHDSWPWAHCLICSSYISIQSFTIHSSFKK